jgi:hypothetical protein
MLTGETITNEQIMEIREQAEVDDEPWLLRKCLTALGYLGHMRDTAIKEIRDARAEVADYVNQMTVAGATGRDD